MASAVVAWRKWPRSPSQPWKNPPRRAKVRREQVGIWRRQRFGGYLRYPRWWFQIYLFDTPVIRIPYWSIHGNCIIAYISTIIYRKNQPQLGGGFKYCYFHPEIWGSFPFWLIFFKWVGSTTNQFPYIATKGTNFARGETVKHILGWACMKSILVSDAGEVDLAGWF